MTRTNAITARRNFIKANANHAHIEAELMEASEARMHAMRDGGPDTMAAEVARLRGELADATREVADARSKYFDALAADLA